MDLFTYIGNAVLRKELAYAVNSSGDYLWQVATGRRNASPLLSLRIENATRGAITRHNLRPDIFGPAPSKSVVRRLAAQKGGAAKPIKKRKVA